MQKLMLFLFFLIQVLYTKSQTIQEIKSVTAFVYESENKPLGTCFFVGIKSPSNPDLSYVYLVTAKHVLQNQTGSFLQRVLIRLNTKDSIANFGYIEIGKNLFLHPDPSVDIAVIAGISGNEHFNLKWLDEEFLSDRVSFKTLPLQEGKDVFFTGLFTGYTGIKKIHPIVRFGRIALLTDEKIEFIGQQREIILIESNSYGGNSGSPVYFNLIHPNGMRYIKLGGILSGTFRDVGEVVESSGKYLPLATVYNNGISGIAPIYLLDEILNNPELSKLRK